MLDELQQKKRSSEIAPCTPSVMRATDQEIELDEFQVRTGDGFEDISIQINSTHSHSDTEHKEPLNVETKNNIQGAPAILDSVGTVWKFFSNDMSAWKKWLGKQTPIYVAPLVFLDRVFRGVSQVVFIENPISGIIITVALLLGDQYVGFWAFMGTLISTFTALLLRLPDADSQQGLHGFNGCLVSAGIALFTNRDWDVTSQVITAIGPAFVVIVQLFLVSLFSRLKVPAFTLPFVCTTWIFLASTYQSNRWNLRILPNHGALPESWDGPSPNITAEIFFVGALKGVSQVYFIDNWISGLLIIIAMLISKPLAGVATIVGTLMGMLMGLAYGANQSSMAIGLWGFNPVLAVTAIFPTFLSPSPPSFVLALYCGIISVVLNAALNSLFVVWGLPTLTLAFCLSSIVCLVASQSIPYWLSHWAEQGRMDHDD